MQREQRNTDDLKLANEHLANERTFLAWLSASVAIMAFGFVVVKFALFARQFAPVLDLPPIKVKDTSAFLGVAIVAVGAIAILASWLRFRKNRMQLRQGRFHHSASSLTLVAAGVFGASLLLVVGLAMAAIRP